MNLLILASSSIYRKELLGRLQLPFTTFSPHVDESRLPDESIEDMAKRLAYEKAKAASKANPHAVVIGADTVAALGENTLGKPLTHDVAFEQLKAQSGKRVTFYSGVSVVAPLKPFEDTRVVQSTVTFRTLTDEMIETYLRKEKPYFSSGAFKSETLGSALITRFEGDDPTALIGLPLIALCALLEAAGVKVL